MSPLTDHAKDTYIAPELSGDLPPENGPGSRLGSGSIEPAPVLGPVLMSEAALRELAIPCQRRTVLQRRLPAPGFLDWNEVAFRCTRPASAR